MITSHMENVEKYNKTVLRIGNGKIERKKYLDYITISTLQSERFSKGNISDFYLLNYFVINVYEKGKKAIRLRTVNNEITIYKKSYEVVNRNKNC